MGGGSRDGGAAGCSDNPHENLRINIGNGSSLGGLQHQVRSMDPEGKEGKKANSIIDIPLSHDLCGRNKELGGNVEDSRGTVQAKDLSHPPPTSATIQHSQDDQ